jgi:hypothetical protein
VADVDGGSTVCIRCGEAVAPDALRCPHCALTFPALTSMGDRAEASAVVGSTGSSPSPGPAAAPMSGAPRPDDTAPQPAFTPTATGGAASVPWRWIAAAGVVVLAVVGVLLLSSGGSDDEVAAGPPPVPVLSLPSYELDEDGLDLVLQLDALEGGDRARLLVDGEQVDDGEGPSPLSLRWTGATEGDHRLIVQVRRGDEQTEAVLDVTVPPPVAGAEVAGRWIMALASFEEPERADRFAADVEGVPDARVLVSDDWASLRPGFWVVYDGPFETGAEVLERCRELGRTIPDACVGRVVSTDEADRSLIANEP